MGASEGPQARSEADPDRAGGQRGRRDPGLPPRLPWRGGGGGPGHRGDDRAEADRRAAPVPAGGRFETDLLHQRGGDGRPGRGIRRAAGRGKGPAGLFAALPPHAGTAMHYIARRDAGKPAAARGGYRVLEDGGMDLPGPRKADPPVHLRRILVYSTANAAAAAKARARKLASRSRSSVALARTAGTQFHPTANAVAARVKAITAKRRAGAYVRTAITRDAAGKPVLSWHFHGHSRTTQQAPRPGLTHVSRIAEET